MKSWLANAVRLSRVNGASALLTASLCWCPSSVLHAQQSTESGFVSIFDGRTLAGWKGESGFWKVEKGAIVGETKAPNQHTTFLYWTGGEPADFELRYRIRVIGEEANSGMQIRSRKRPGWDALGYQVDFDASGYSLGTLYHYQREPSATFVRRGDSVLIDAKGHRTVTKFADAGRLLDAHRKNNWNDFRIVAQGPRVSVWMNDVLMCSVEDHEQRYTSPSGILALQLHSGEPMRVELTNIRMRAY